MINYKYSISEVLSKPASSPSSSSSASSASSAASASSSSIVGHHKRSNSVHLQHSPQQQHPPSFERKNSQESSVLSFSDRSITSPSSLPVTPQEGSRQVSTILQQRMSEPIIDLNKITEEYNNCQRRLSIASMKKANESLVHWRQFLQEDEDTRFYAQELNQNGINASSGLSSLPISSEILLEQFNENHEEKNEHEDDDECEDDVPKRHSNQLMRTLSKLTRRNSLSMIKTSRKSTASV
ncbi:hypothetical protein Cantr_02169 [Candida viswanathii]|uniref:Uncharacterized protein n=1 Tax=Candida viswanathii TaxID=5486 RepID=A0A367YKY3_9ASCO|nr:hypothetical protein Cantr_02169 [Candida viswanathii]